MPMQCYNRNLYISYHVILYVTMSCLREKKRKKGFNDDDEKTKDLYIRLYLTRYYIPSIHPIYPIHPSIYPASSSFLPLARPLLEFWF